MSYVRMKQEEVRLDGEIGTLVREIERLDLNEDKRYGKSHRGNELPQELQRQEERLQKIRESMQALEREAKEKSVPRIWDDRDGNPPSTSAVSDNKTQRNCTDPESKIMPEDKTFIQGHNARAAVDAKRQIIVACD